MAQIMDEEELWKAIDGLYAYDCGSVSSGVRDETLRAKVKETLLAMHPQESRRMLTRLFRDNYLTDERIREGYGLEDAAIFWRWLDEDMGCAL